MRAATLLVCFFVWQQRQAAGRQPLGPTQRGLRGRASEHAFAVQSTRRSLISNGEEAPEGRWPYVCALGRASRSVDTVTYEEQACGASLIHPQVALTAAHCASTDQGYARAGLAVLCNSTELGTVGDGALFRRVTQSLVHPDSPQAAAAALRKGAPPQPLSGPPDFTAGDVALLLLDAPLEGLPLVAVATPQDYAGVGAAQQEVWVVGWGATGDDADPASYPRTLREAALPLVSADRCEQVYRQQSITVDGQYGRLDPALSICAGFTVGNRSLPCEGDSGGPLLYAPTPDPVTHIQLGVVSGGAGQCGGPALPVVFTRLDRYQGWVAAALREVDAMQRLPAGPGQRGPEQLAPLLGRDGG